MISPLQQQSACAKLCLGCVGARKSGGGGIGSAAVGTNSPSLNTALYSTCKPQGSRKWAFFVPCAWLRSSSTVQDTASSGAPQIHRQQYNCRVCEHKCCVREVTMMPSQTARRYQYSHVSPKGSCRGVRVYIIRKVHAACHVRWSKRFPLHIMLEILAQSFMVEGTDLLLTVNIANI